MNTELLLKDITDRIQDFNSSNELFIVEINIRKKEKKAYFTFDHIMEMVSNRTGLMPEYIRMETRETKIVRARQMCHFIACRKTKKSLSAIGLYFGGKDHATVLHGKKSIQNLLDTDSEFYEKYKDLLLIN